MVCKLIFDVENYQQLLTTFVNKLLLLYKNPNRSNVCQTYIAMVRKNIVSFSLILVFYFGSVSAQEVIVSISVSDQIVAGTDVLVEVMITKTVHDGFARFQQELPVGITAKGGQSSNADFDFKDQRVNLIWLKLPAGEHLKFNYIIHAHETVKGDFSIAGKFSYIEEDDRNEVTVPPMNITITPSPNINPIRILDIADFKEGATEAEVTLQTFDIACYREVPYFSETDNSWIVNILLSRGEVSRLARVEEQVPEGFVAESVNNIGSIFSFKSGIAKFLWMELPGDPLLLLSYKLVPREGQTLAEGAIKGTFTYMQGDVSKSIPIVEKGVQLTDVSTSELTGIMASLQGREEKPVKPVTEVQKPAEQVTQPVRQETQAGVVYKIQISATRKPVNKERFFRPYKIEREISSEFHDGWYKYTTGSFLTYRDARNFASQLLKTSGLEEAFICAYADGKRIPVKTALKLTNQVWFK